MPVIRHAPGKGSCYVVAVAGEEVYVLAVDKAGFHQHGRHGGLAQDAEGEMGFDAARLMITGDIRLKKAERRSSVYNAKVADYIAKVKTERVVIDYEC